MKYGIRSGMLGEPLEKEFSTAKELGFDGIEFCIGSNYKNELLWTDGGVEKLKSLSVKNGIEICSLSPGVFASLHPALPDDGKRVEGIQMMKRIIELCVPLEARWILVPMFPRDVNNWTNETWVRLFDGFKILAEIAEKHNVILGIESTFSADDLLKIFDEVGSENICAYYDVGNMTYLGENIAQGIIRLGKKICMFHIKDTDGKMLGEGRVDFKGLSEAIKKIGYDGYLVLETPSGSDPKESAIRNLSFTKNLFS